MKSPITSVVIPAYNAEKTIAETVNSVLAQTFNDFELIIINDGSTDQTLAILQQFTDPRIQVLTFENSGPQRSRNRGIQHSQGKYISFIDADDLWTIDKLELQIDVLQSNQEAAVVYSWTDVIDENSDLLRRGGYPNKKGHVFADLLLGNFLENGSNFLAYTENVKSIGGFDETIVAGQDRDIALSLAAKYSFCMVPKVQILYRKPRTLKTWSSHIERARLGIHQVLDKHLAEHTGLQKYYRVSLGNSYKYLVVECLKDPPSRKRSIYCLELLWTLILNDKRLISKKVFFKICLRLSLVILLPKAVSSAIMHQHQGLFDITTLYGYLRTEV